MDSDPALAFLNRLTWMLEFSNRRPDILRQTFLDNSSLGDVRSLWARVRKALQFRHDHSTLLDGKDLFVWGFFWYYAVLSLSQFAPVVMPG